MDEPIVTLELSLTDARHLRNVANGISTNSRTDARTKRTLVAYLDLAIARVEHDAPVTGLDLYHEHRGTPRPFDPTDQATPEDIAARDLHAYERDLDRN